MKRGQNQNWTEQGREGEVGEGEGEKGGEWSDAGRRREKENDILGRLINLNSIKPTTFEIHFVFFQTKL